MATGEQYPDWQMPIVHKQPPAQEFGTTSNDLCDFVMSFDHKDGECNTEDVFYTFSEVVKNRNLFIGPFLYFAAEYLRCIIGKILYMNEYNDGPHVVYFEKEIEKLKELVVLIEASV